MQNFWTFFKCSCITRANPVFLLLSLWCLDQVPCCWSSEATRGGKRKTLDSQNTHTHGKIERKKANIIFKVHTVPYSILLAYQTKRSGDCLLPLHAYQAKTRNSIWGYTPWEGFFSQNGLWMLYFPPWERYIYTTFGLTILGFALLLYAVWRRARTH